MNAFTDELKQKIEEDIILILYTIFQKTEEKEILSNSLHEASITLLSKPKMARTQNAD